MATKAAGLTTLALVALASQGIGSVPSSPSAADLSRAPAVSGVTGLTSDDLVVGLDGAVNVDVKASQMKMACRDNGSGCMNNQCC
jgi:hypothetical protein